MGNGGGGGGCRYTDQTDAIEQEKRNVYGLINAIRSIEKAIRDYGIGDKTDIINKLEDMRSKLQAAYEDAKNRERVRDRSVQYWQEQLQIAITKNKDEINQLLANTNLEEQKRAFYSDALQQETQNVNNLQFINGINNAIEKSIEFFTKAYYNTLYSETNGALSQRVNNKQYKDLYSTDNQRINYISQDNEYLSALNYVFFIAYYILAVFVLYIIFFSNITTFSKIAMVLVVLLYPILIYNIQRTVHYAWESINKPVIFV